MAQGQNTANLEVLAAEIKVLESENPCLPIFGKSLSNSTNEFLENDSEKWLLGISYVLVDQ